MTITVPVTNGNHARQILAAAYDYDRSSIWGGDGRWVHGAAIHAIYRAEECQHQFYLGQ